MALRTSRTLTSRGRPPRLAGGIIDARNPLGVSQITRITKAVSIGRSAVFRLPHVRITPPMESHPIQARFNKFLDRL